MRVRCRWIIALFISLSTLSIPSGCTDNTPNEELYHPILDPSDIGPPIKEPLIRAAAEGDLIQVKELVNSGHSLNSVSESGWSALAIAVRYKHTDIVIFLCEKGADVWLTDRHGLYPLESAVAHAEVGENVEIVKALVKAGADPDRKGPNMLDTPRKYAQDVEALEMLQAMDDGLAERIEN